MVVGEEVVVPAPRLAPANGVVKLDFQWTIGTDTNGHNHLFFGVSAAPSLAQLNALCSAAATAWGAGGFRAVFPTTSILNQFEAIDLSNPAALPGVGIVGGGGQLTSPGITAETAVLVNMKVARRYKGGHPRVYFPAGASTDISAPQAWSAAFTGTFQTAFQTFLTSVQGASGGPSITGLVNVSYYSGKSSVTGKPVPRPTPLVEPIVSWSVNPIPGSQRRRMGR